MICFIAVGVLAVLFLIFLVAQFSVSMRDSLDEQAECIQRDAEERARKRRAKERAREERRQRRQEKHGKDQR